MSLPRESRENPDRRNLSKQKHLGDGWKRTEQAVQEWAERWEKTQEGGFLEPGDCLRKECLMLPGILW